MPLYKTNKKMKFMDITANNYHGVTSLPSDNIKNIVNHNFEKDYLEEKTKREQDILLKVLLKEENVRSEETKASKLRNQAIKDKMDNIGKQEAKFKLKQYDNVKASNYISETTKNIKNAAQESVKKSNIETESVLKIADLNKLNASAAHDKKDEPKDMYFGEEVQQLKDGGANIYSYDIKQNKIMNGAPQSGSMLGSKMRSKRATGANLNRSVDNKYINKRVKSSLQKQDDDNDQNSSILPNIKQQITRRNISQIRKDEGEYSRLLANKNNNRLVQAQQTIDEALRKHSYNSAARNERNSMGKTTSNIYSEQLL
jgi:hypothetical protein